MNVIRTYFLVSHSRKIQGRLLRTFFKPVYFFKVENGIGKTLTMSKSHTGHIKLNLIRVEFVHVSFRRWFRLAVPPLLNVKNTQLQRFFCVKCISWNEWIFQKGNGLKLAYSNLLNGPFFTRALSGFFFLTQNQYSCQRVVYFFGTAGHLNVLTASHSWLNKRIPGLWRGEKVHKTCSQVFTREKLIKKAYERKHKKISFWNVSRH